MSSGRSPSASADQACNRLNARCFSGVHLSGEGGGIGGEKGQPQRKHASAGAAAERNNPRERRQEPLLAHSEGARS